MTNAQSTAVVVIGGGLAGCEAAWQIAVVDARFVFTKCGRCDRRPAHKTDHLAEIVCSNSLKSDQPFNASWLLKQELRQMGSLLMRVADSVRVPAGSPWPSTARNLRRRPRRQLRAIPTSSCGVRKSRRSRQSGRQHCHSREWSPDFGRAFGIDPELLRCRQPLLL
jgi:hypothetical protein